MFPFSETNLIGLALLKPQTRDLWVPNENTMKILFSIQIRKFLSMQISSQLLVENGSNKLEKKISGKNCFGKNFKIKTTVESL